MDEVRNFDRMLSGIIDANDYVEPEKARKRTIRKAIENCDTKEYILTTQVINERIGELAFYNFFFLYMDGRLHNCFPEECYIKVKVLGGDNGFIELHSAITGETLEWKYCEGISKTESVRP